MSVGGSIGWWAGEPISFTMAFILSGIGSMIGVYIGWKINRNYF